MPTYDYKCSECGAMQEVFHGMNDAPSVLCEVCGSKARKQIGAGAGIIFKGSGFYETDYRSSGYEAAAKADKAAAAEPAAAPKTESKPESKPQGKTAESA